MTSVRCLFGGRGCAAWIGVVDRVPCYDRRIPYDRCDVYDWEEER